MAAAFFFGLPEAQAARADDIFFFPADLRPPCRVFFSKRCATSKGFTDKIKKKKKKKKRGRSATGCPDRAPPLNWRVTRGRVTCISFGATRAYGDPRAAAAGRADRLEQTVTGYDFFPGHLLPRQGGFSRQYVPACRPRSARPTSPAKKLSRARSFCAHGLDVRAGEGGGGGGGQNAICSRP